MNEPTDPTTRSPRSPFANVPPLPVTPPDPLPPQSGLGVLLETLLKRPASLMETLRVAGSSRVAFLLAGAALFALAAYGLVIGTFSGGDQFWAAPLKVSLGALVCALICFPSLFIFTCLSGAEVTLRGVLGVLSAVMALTSLLLIGFAPVAWVFSQSTDSVAFMGALHLAIWLLALGFGLRMLSVFMKNARAPSGMHLKVWTIIFILVSLQMSTALRPIIGRSDSLLPKEKKFFVAHWLEQLYGTGAANGLTPRR